MSVWRSTTAGLVHAPSKGGYVRIDWLNAAPYARGFIGARRIVPPTAAPRMQ